MNIGQVWKINIPPRKFILKLLGFLFTCNFIFYFFFSSEPEIKPELPPELKIPAGHVAVQLSLTPHLELKTKSEVGLWSSQGKLLIERAIFVKNESSTSEDGLKATLLIKKESLHKVVGESHLHAMPMVEQEAPLKKISNHQEGSHYDISF